jgi:YVTN family beta-propeller protein
MRKRFATALGVVISLAAVLLLDGCAAPADPDPTSMPQFAVSQRAALGGAGGWDFISFDSARQRLFISRGDRVQVWSASTGQVTGEIAQTEGVHGIALAPELGRGFTSNGRSNTVTAFALEDLTVLAKVPVPGGNPDAILYEPVFKRVYVFNGRSHDVSILDAMTLRVIRTIPLGGKPEVGVSDDTGTVFVNIEDTSEIVALDPKTNSVSARWSLAPCEEPTGLAIDTAHSRLFSVCANKRMAVVDSRSGRIVAQVPIDAQPDGAAFDPALGIAWSSNGAGTLTMVRSDRLGQYRAVATVATQPKARTLALDPVTHRLYLVSAAFGFAPAPTAKAPHPRAPMLPDSFEVLVVAPR